jgi:hypothetical protein
MQHLDKHICNVRLKKDQEHILATYVYNHLQQTQHTNLLLQRPYTTHISETTETDLQHVLKTPEHLKHSIALKHSVAGGRQPQPTW